MPPPETSWTSSLTSAPSANRRMSPPSPDAVRAAVEAARGWALAAAQFGRAKYASLAPSVSKCRWRSSGIFSRELADLVYKFIIRIYAVGGVAAPDGTNCHDFSHPCAT